MSEPWKTAFKDVWTDWSITEETAERLFSYLTDVRPKRILEVGSGVSTVILAAYAAKYDARVMTLEHEKHWHDKTQRALRTRGLTRCVELVLKDLHPRQFEASGQSRSLLWYDAEEALIEHVNRYGPFDFAFVDGPPQDSGREAVLPSIVKYLEGGWTLWLDDGNRDHERACLSLWRMMFPGIDAQFMEHDHKGAWLVRESAPAAASGRELVEPGGLRV